jgi:hypothetical protein
VIVIKSNSKNVKKLFPKTKYQSTTEC